MRPAQEFLRATRNVKVEKAGTRLQKLYQLTNLVDVVTTSSISAAAGGGSMVIQPGALMQTIREAAGL